MYPLDIAQYMAASAFFAVALLHLLVWSRNREFLPHLFFAWTAAAAGGNAVSEAWMYRAESVDAFVPALKSYVTFSGLWLIGLIWFVITASRIRTSWSWWLAVTLTGFFVVGIVVNVLAPFSFLYSDISSLRVILLPWNEQVAFANGSNAPWRFSAEIAEIGFLILVFAGAIELWRNGERWRASLLGGSLSIFMIFFGVVAMLVDVGILNWPYLTTYGFLIVVMVTSNDLAKEISNAADLSQEIIENERRWRSLLDNLPTLVVGLDRFDRINYVNAFFENFTGYQSPEILGQPFSHLVTENETPRLKQLFLETMDGSPHAETELTLVTRLGVMRTVRWTKVPLEDTEGKIVGRLGIGSDITEQRKNDAALRQAVDDERSRIAGDLHDSVTQTLFSTAAIADALPEVWNRYPEKARQGLEDLRQMTKGALAEMRTLLLELRPESLLKKSISDLLSQLGDAIATRARMPVKVDVSYADQLPEKVQIAVYRIAQEALNNVIKHSEATDAKLQLHHADDNVILVISDNGLGFEPNQAESGRLGLGIMRDRARSIDANLRIETRPDMGTTITVTWKHQLGRDTCDGAETHSGNDG